MIAQSTTLHFICDFLRRIIKHILFTKIIKSFTNLPKSPSYAVDNDIFLLLFTIVSILVEFRFSVVSWSHTAVIKDRCRLLQVRSPYLWLIPGFTLSSSHSGRISGHFHSSPFPTVPTSHLRSLSPPNCHLEEPLSTNTSASHSRVYMNISL